MICPLYLPEFSALRPGSPVGWLEKTPKSPTSHNLREIVLSVQPSLASMASNSWPAMFRSKILSSSRIPVGLVTLISVR